MKEVIIKDEKLLKALEKYAKVEECTVEELVIKILQLFIEAQQKNKEEDYAKKYIEERLARKQKIEKAISNL